MKACGEPAPFVRGLGLSSADTPARAPNSMMAGVAASTSEPTPRPMLAAPSPKTLMIPPAIAEPARCATPASAGPMSGTMAAMKGMSGTPSDEGQGASSERHDAGLADAGDEAQQPPP